MKIEAIKTRIIHPPQDDLLEAIKASLPSIPEKSILAVTSKVVSIWEGRCVPDTEDKDELIKQEADQYIPREELEYGWVMHTVNNNILSSSAGIDHSNGDGYYVLWPKDSNKTAREIRTWLQKTYGVQDVGVVITDSRSMPLRRGAVGMALGHAGFIALKDYRETPDIFGNDLQVSISNIVDSVAGMAVLAMGEGKETTPLALISELPEEYFKDWDKESDKPYSSLEVEPEEDMYFPLIGTGKWKKGGKNKE
jgi:F420-0:gamma-glutamyl ligase